MSERDIQADFYARTAESYDTMHAGREGQALQVGLCFLSGFISGFGIRSVLSVGAGTGREILSLKAHHPGLQILGVEPVEAMRRVGHVKGLGEDELVEGDATDLPYESGSFDVVMEFAALHHIRRNDLAVREMVRVARKAVFLHDVNNFGQGSFVARCAKQALRGLRLWPAAVHLKTRGKGYHFSEGDGVYYSYSVFDSIPLVEPKFPVIHYLNAAPSPSSFLYHAAPGVAILARKGDMEPSVSS